MINILQLISSSGYYGAESMLVLLSRHLTLEGCNVIIGALADPRKPRPELANQATGQGVRTVVIPCSGRLDWRAFGEIRRIIVEAGVNVVHSHGYKSNLYALLAARRNVLALIATAHAWQSQHLRVMRLYARLDRFILREFDRIATVSDVLRQQLQSAGVDPARVRTISNAIEIPQAIPLPAFLVEPGCPNIGMVGRLSPEKGGDVLIRCAAKVIGRFPKATFFLIGDGPCRSEWESLSRQLGIARHIVFTGVRSDIQNVYAALDIVALPSFNEGLPMCLLEAAAAARAVIATPVGAVETLVMHGKTGLIVAPGEPDELASSILRLLDNPGEASRLGANAKAHVGAAFSAPVMTRQYLEMYHDAICSRSTARDTETYCAKGA